MRGCTCLCVQLSILNERLHLPQCTTEYIEWEVALASVYNWVYWMRGCTCLSVYICDLCTFPWYLCSFPIMIGEVSLCKALEKERRHTLCLYNCTKTKSLQSSWFQFFMCNTLLNFFLYFFAEHLMIPIFLSIWWRYTHTSLIYEWSASITPQRLLSPPNFPWSINMYNGRFFAG